MWCLVDVRVVLGAVGLIRCRRRYKEVPAVIKNHHRPPVRPWPVGQRSVNSGKVERVF